jgi:hypothetical protein
MSTALATVLHDPGAIMEAVIAKGDLAELTAQQRAEYYCTVCRSIGLNELTKPFDYIVLNDKLTLYATRGATDQLRAIRGVTIEIVSREMHDGVYVVTARATTPDGRSDESTGAVSLVKENGQWKTNDRGKRYLETDGTFRPLGPDDRANAIMKAETKAKRRVTLSICGLGWLDESEIETVPGARRARVDTISGEIQDEPTQIHEVKPEAKKKPLTDKQFGQQVREAMAARDATMFRKLVEEARDETGRWIALVQAAESPQALDWIKRQIERNGVANDVLSLEIRKREEQIDPPSPRPIVEQPDPPAVERDVTPTGGKPATQGQLDMIRNLAQQLDMSDTEIERTLKSVQDADDAKDVIAQFSAKVLDATDAEYAVPATADL